MVEVPDLNVTYGSLQALTTPSYSLPDMSNAVTVLSQGFSNNNLWGPAFATLIGVTSDAIKSIGMKRHVCFGLNVKSKIAHFPSNRLLRINKCWDKISKSIRSLRFDYVLKYKDEKGRDVEEAVTKFSAGLIFAIINSKDGSKEEKLKNKQKKDQFKRKRDANEEREYGGRREAGRGTGFKQQKGNQAPQNRGGKYQRSASGSAPGDTAAEEEHPSFLCNSMTSEEEKEEWNILADKIPEPNEEYPNAFIRVDKEPPFDYSDEEDRPFVVRVVPRNCDPSDSSSSYFSKSDSDETIGEEESGINKESSPKDWEKQLEFLPEDQTSTEPIEERLDLVFDLDSRIEAIQLAKSSTTELVSGPTVPSSSILVKHGGTKRPAESAVGDEDFKRANKMLMSKSTDDQNNKTETELDVQVNKKIS